jgi:hypothetical protein
MVNVKQGSWSAIVCSIVDHNMGMGFEVNINQYGEQAKKKGDYFRHGGFNSGY